MKRASERASAGIKVCTHRFYGQRTVKRQNFSLSLYPPYTRERSLARLLIRITALGRIMQLLLRVLFENFLGGRKEWRGREGGSKNSLVPNARGRARTLHSRLRGGREDVYIERRREGEREERGRKSIDWMEQRARDTHNYCRERGRAERERNHRRQ